MEIPEGEISEIDGKRYAVTCPHCGFPEGTNGNQGLQLRLCWFCKKHYVYEGVLVVSEHKSVAQIFKE